MLLSNSRRDTRATWTVAVAIESVVFREGLQGRELLLKIVKLSGRIIFLFYFGSMFCEGVRDRRSSQLFLTPASEMLSSSTLNSRIRFSCARKEGE